MKQIWEEFCKLLKGYGGADSWLNPPCPPEVLAAVEQDLGLELPSPLRELLALNDGQLLDRPGIFKSVSGWDLYRRLVFLDTQSIVEARRVQLADEDLVREFGEPELVFAIAGTVELFTEAYSIHLESGHVSLLWTFAHDWTLPVDWQLGKFPRGRSLDEFLTSQIGMYR